VQQAAYRPRQAARCLYSRAAPARIGSSSHRGSGIRRTWAGSSSGSRSPRAGYRGLLSIAERLGVGARARGPPMLAVPTLPSALCIAQWTPMQGPTKSKEREADGRAHPKGGCTTGPSRATWPCAGVKQRRHHPPPAMASRAPQVAPGEERTSAPSGFRRAQLITYWHALHGVQSVPLSSLCIAQWASFRHTSK